MVNRKYVPKKTWFLSSYVPKFVAFSYLFLYYILDVEKIVPWKVRPLLAVWMLVPLLLLILTFLFFEIKGSWRGIWEGMKDFIAMCAGRVTEKYWNLLSSEPLPRSKKLPTFWPKVKTFTLAIRDFLWVLIKGFFSR